MVILLKIDEITYGNLLAVLEKMRGKKSKRTKNLKKFYGCLNWGIGGVEYQRKIHDEWD